MGSSRRYGKMPNHKMSGFSLAELVITLVIIGIITAIAVPSYSNYVTRNKLTEAMTNLQDLRLRMEQFYQDNRTYRNADNNCAIEMPNLDNFTIVCVTPNRGAYTLTATNKNNVGLGDPGDYEYSLDDQGDALTVTFAGTASGKECLTVSNRC